MVYISAFTCIHTHIGVVGGSLIRRFPMFRIGLVSVLYVWERELSSEYLQYWPLVQFWTPSSVTQCRRSRGSRSPRRCMTREGVQNWTTLAPWWWLVDWWYLAKNPALDSKCSLCLPTAHAVLNSPNLRVTLVKICGSASGNREKQQHYFGPLSTKYRLQTGDWVENADWE